MFQRIGAIELLMVACGSILVPAALLALLIYLTVVVSRVSSAVKRIEALVAQSEERASGPDAQPSPSSCGTSPK